MVPTLPRVKCPDCGQWLESKEFTPKGERGASRASGFDSCLRRCESCGVGFSNANTADVTKLTVIRRDPIPQAVKEHAEEVLSLALNEQHRSSKRKEFQSHRSEDAVTWTVFRYLQSKNLLGHVLQVVEGEPAKPEQEPTLLLWGSPVPPGDPAALQLRKALVQVGDAIGERPGSRSEPDVIMDFHQAGVCIIEVKLGSPNEMKNEGYSGWPFYTDRTAAFVSHSDVCRSGCYELARNWRIGWDLAGTRPFTLINLGPAGLFDKQRGELERFDKSLSKRADRRFRRLAWTEFLTSVLPASPDWFRSFVNERGVLS